MGEPDTGSGIFFKIADMQGLSMYYGRLKVTSTDMIPDTVNDDGAKKEPGTSPPSADPQESQMKPATQVKDTYIYGVSVWMDVTL